MKILNKNIYLNDFIPPIFSRALNYLKRLVRRLSSGASDKKNAAPVTLPSHKIKQSVIKEYASKYNIKAFVESGTLYGDMVNAVRKIFTRIYSIELSKELYERALEWFSDYSNIHLINGDSGEVMPSLIKQIDEPCLFWLDGHYSGGVTAKGELNTPIVKELKSIFPRPYEDVIIIDDAREFTGLGDYPSIEYIEKLLRRYHYGWTVEVKDDIIRIYKDSAK